MTPSLNLMAEITAFRAEHLAPQDFTQLPVLERQLRMCYHIMQATPGHLAMAFTQTPANNPILKHYFRVHFQEEQDHGPWMGRDLLASGIDAYPIPREAMQMAGVQYYMIRHIGAETLLGYMMSMEPFVPSVETVDATEALHPGLVLSCLRHHAEVDAGHTADLLAIVDLQPEAAQPLIREAALAATGAICAFTQGGVNA